MKGLLFVTVTTQAEMMEWKSFVTNVDVYCLLVLFPRVSLDWGVWKVLSILVSIVEFPEVNEENKFSVRYLLFYILPPNKTTLPNLENFQI